MSRQFSRRALIAGAGAVAGGYLASQVRSVDRLTSRIGNVRLQSISLEPLYIALLDRHAQRIQPLIPSLERSLNRRLQIDALSSEQLYANYTIDLLQQTGRYDLVSINDHWIPYFGRRGYLSEVDSLADADSPVPYPPLVEAAAVGIDGTRLVAYPWSIDFTCSAVHANIASSVPDASWHSLVDAIESVPGISVGVGLQSPRSAAETYRSVLLSFGQEILRDDDGEPVLTHHWQERSLDLIVRMARKSTSIDPLSTNLERLSSLAVDGAFNLLPVLWASDSRGLLDLGAWALRALPSGRIGRRRSFVAVWMWGIPAGAPNRDKAREFVEAFTGPEIQSQLWSTSSLLPANRAAIQSDDPGWLSLRPLVFDALDHGRLRPALRSYRSIMDIVGQAVAQAVSTGQSIAQVLDAANQEVRTVLVNEDELKGLT